MVPNFIVPSAASGTRKSFLGLALQNHPFSVSGKVGGIVAGPLFYLRPFDLVSAYPARLFGPGRSPTPLQPLCPVDHKRMNRRADERSSDDNRIDPASAFDGCFDLVVRKGSKGSKETEERGRGEIKTRAVRPHALPQTRVASDEQTTRRVRSRNPDLQENRMALRSCRVQLRANFDRNKQLPRQPAITSSPSMYRGCVESERRRRENRGCPSDTPPTRTWKIRRS